jgi:signal recognition particle subunit SRP54
MFEQLSEKFTEISKRLRGQAHMTEANLDDILRELRLSLLEADVALPVVRDFLSKVKEESVGKEVLKSLTPGQMFVGIFHQQLQQTLGGSESTPWSLRAAAPAVILMAGLQGVGKTTQTAKLARWLKNQKKRVLVVSCDAYRPAAIEQLKTLAEQVEVDFFPPPPVAINAQGKIDPLQVALMALNDAKQRLYDVLIVDTAGRLSVDEAMMSELAAIENAIHPDETFLVIDAMQGQNALATAEAFAGRVTVSGLILTKADGDSRGGAVLSARMVTGAPVRFAGVSEKMDGLEVFDAKRMADRIVGMGDMVGLFESAVAHIDQEAALKFAHKLGKGKGFSLNDFRAQLVQMRKMGGLESILEKMPSEVKKMVEKMPQQFADREVARMQGIIDSMTKRERRYPDLIKASRKKRIANGSGTSVQEVNKLLSQFEQMEKMGKKFKGMGGMLAKLGVGGGMGAGSPDMASMNHLLRQIKR